MKRSLTILLLFLSTLGWCGNFVLRDANNNIKPTGGTCIQGGAPPPPYGPSTDYYWSGGWWMGAGTLGGSCSGTVTWRWKWEGGGTAPSSVVLKVEANAFWGPATNGMCSNDLGDTPVSAPTSPGSTMYVGSCDGPARFVVMPVVNDTVTYTISPVADTSNGSCSVRMRVEPMFDQEAGTGPVGTDNRLAIGQRLALELVSTAPILPSDTFFWNVSGGAPFSNYQADDDLGLYTPFSTPGIFSKTLTCYFAKEENVTITCTHFSTYTGKTVTSTYNVSVKRPIHVPYGGEKGTMRLRNGGQTWQPGQGTPTQFSLFGVQDLSYVPPPGQPIPFVGMYDRNALKDPTGCGIGEVGYAQLRDRTSVTNGVADPPEHGLDGGFPYYPLQYCTNSQNQFNIAKIDDTPGLASFLGTWPYSGSFDGTYRTYLMYKPANNAAGSSVFVPIFKRTWTAKGQCATTNGTTWTQSDNGSTFGDIDPADGSRSYFPEWP